MINAHTSGITPRGKDEVRRRAFVRIEREVATEFAEELQQTHGLKLLLLRWRLRREVAKRLRRTASDENLYLKDDGSDAV